MQEDRNVLESDRARIGAVIEFAENVLKNGRDRYRENPSPLFCDGINVDTLEPVKWNFPDIGEGVISNLATQQNLFRTLVLLSSLTGESRYKDAAKDAIGFTLTIWSIKAGCYIGEVIRL